MTNDELANAYHDLRVRCLELGRNLSDGQASTMSSCCPAWSVKDLYAHMAGVPSDILSGNLEGVATEAWADAQVAARRGHALGAICDEWETKGAEVDAILRTMADQIMPQFFLDAWTHEWDIRQALGAGAEPDLRLAEHVQPLLAEFFAERNGGVAMQSDVSLFELARVAMGRRSLGQIEALGLDPAVVVYWTASETDIFDPVG